MKMNLGENTKWGGGSRKQKRYKNKDTKEIAGGGGVGGKIIWERRPEEQARKATL